MATHPRTPAAFAAEAYARRLEDETDPFSCELVPVARLAPGDAVLCVAGDSVPGGGRVIDGFAAIRRPSGAAAVVRESCDVERGALVLWGHVVLRLSDRPR